MTRFTVLITTVVFLAFSTISIAQDNGGSDDNGPSSPTYSTKTGFTKGTLDKSLLESLFEKK